MKPEKRQSLLFLESSACEREKFVAFPIPIILSTFALFKERLKAGSIVWYTKENENPSVVQRDLPCPDP